MFAKLSLHTHNLYTYIYVYILFREYALIKYSELLDPQEMFDYFVRLSPFDSKFLS